MDLKGKSIVVAGASGGMGQVVCRELAKIGAKLAICADNEEKLQKQYEELTKEYGAEVFAKKVDVTNEEEIKAFIDEAYEKYGELYALANLAGLSIPGKISETDEEAYCKMMDVNVKGTFLMSKHFSGKAASPAIIVNIGSMAARNANPNAPLYCTAKAALNMLSQGMLLQMGSKDIRVTTVNPGGADTPFWGNRTVDKSKLMSAEDVAEIILFVLQSNPRIQIHDIYFESTAKFK